MKRRHFAFCAFGLLFVLATPRMGVSGQSNASYKLEVHVKYTGAGAVNEQHKIYVVLWDSADFMNGENAMPVAMLTTSSKDGSVTFDDVKTTPAYVSTVYDPTG